MSVAHQEHFGLYLDEKLNFNHHINVKISKANKGIGIIKRFLNILPGKSLITIFTGLSEKKTIKGVEDMGFPGVLKK